MKFKYFVCFLMLLLSYTGEASEKEKIMWQVLDWPPIMEINSATAEVKGGQFGLQMEMIKSMLPEYEHVNRNMGWKRFWYLMEKGENICNCMAYKNEKRMTIAKYSIPMTLILPNYIVMRKNKSHKNDQLDSLSLIDLLNNNALKGILIENRSYSAGIDNILMVYKKNENVIRKVINEKNALDMLYHKRMDYFIEYPFVVNYTIKKYFPDYKNSFVSIPIEENAPYYFVHVVCTNNKWGEKIIKKVNNVLLELRADEDFKKTLEAMYDKDQLKKVLKYYHEFLLKAND